MAPWGPFQCQDGYVGIIVATEGDWAKFCTAIERPDLVGREGATSGPERAKNMTGWLGEVINAWFLEHTKAEASAKLLAAGLPIGPVQDAKEVFDDAHVAARKLMIDVPDPVLGSVRLVGPVAKMSSDTTPVTAAAPRLGEHSGEILKEMLRYTEEDVARLKSEGVISEGER
jgi:crotonobetainyl-CoA:carnitine CoA-transferase CaiB-like acyl-CoA transferase